MVTWIALRNGAYTALPVTFGVVTSASLTDLLNEVIMPHKVVLKAVLFTRAALVLATHESIPSPHRRAGVLLTGTLALMGAGAWAEVHLTGGEPNPWWMFPLLAIGLAVFLYPVGVG